MQTSNLYWPVYKNLEKEFLVLADYIHISDDQIGIYSMHIADLIIRCAVEIEAISKELYNSVGGDMYPTDRNGNRRDLYFDTDCLDLLEQKWHICKKEITISAVNLFLTVEKNRVLAPLHKANKRGSSGSKWKQAYQAIKHDRKNSLRSANIENLLKALGSLFILNLYYQEEQAKTERVFLSDRDFDSRAGSEIFSAHCCHATGLTIGYNMDDSCINPPLSKEEIERSIYIIKYTEKSYREMHKNFCSDIKITEQRFYSSPIIAKFLTEHPEYINKSINETCLAAGGTSLLTKIVCLQHFSAGGRAHMEAIINKHGNIYPPLSLESNSNNL